MSAWKRDGWKGCHPVSALSVGTVKNSRRETAYGRSRYMPLAYTDIPFAYGTPYEHFTYFALVQAFVPALDNTMGCPLTAGHCIRKCLPVPGDCCY